MVAAVSEAGALGTIGPNAGAKTAADGRRIGTEERLRNEFRLARTLTTRPVGINVYSPPEGTAVAPYTRTLLEVSFDEGIRHFAIVGTANSELYRLVKDGGGIIIHRELTPTPDEARRAEALGADLLVATGTDEGGWLPQNGIGTFTIVPTIVDAVSIPVLAAGGINDIRGVRAAFALGAQGVYVGTRFVASTECPAAESTKREIINRGGSSLVFATPKQRSTPTPYALALNAELRSGTPGKELEERVEQNGGLRPAMLEGMHDKGIISVNTGIDLIKEIKPCADIVKELMADFM